MECLVSDLHDHPQNEFFFDPMEGQKRVEFIESIKVSGVIEPLIITQDNIIVSGHQRKAACEELGIESVPCVVRQYEDRDGISKEQWIIKDLIDTNVQQRGAVGGSELKAIRRVDALRGIYHVQHGGSRSAACSKMSNRHLAPTMKLGDVCVEAGVTLPTYNRYKQIATLPEEIQQMLDEGKLCASLAADIARRLTLDEQELLVSNLPIAEKISSKIAEPLIAEIERLRADNAFFQSDEDAASRKIDEIDLAAKKIREENERIKAGRGTDTEIALREERDAAIRQAASLESKAGIIEADLKRQKEMRAIDIEVGRVAECQVINLCNLILSTITPLSELPTSVFFRIGDKVRQDIATIIANSINGLEEIQTLLVTIPGEE